MSRAMIFSSSTIRIFTDGISSGPFANLSPQSSFAARMNAELLHPVPELRAGQPRTFGRADLIPPTISSVLSMSSRTTSLILTPVRRISRLNPLPFSSTTIPGCPSPRCVFISSRRPVHGNVVRRLDTTDSHGDGSFPSITLLTTASNSVSPYGLETSARAPFFASCDRICGSKNPLATTTFTEGSTTGAK